MESSRGSHEAKMCDMRDNENGDPFFGSNKGEIKGMRFYEPIECA
jgi:hypothetical protein